MPLTEDIANSLTFMDMFLPCLAIYGFWISVYLFWLIFFGRFHGKNRTGYEHLYEWDMLNYTTVSKICFYNKE